ncbi:MAG: alpha/beta fold hydrolase [Burkholderiaceae bacterium]
MKKFLIGDRIVETEPMQLRTVGGEILPIRAQSLKVLEYFTTHPNEVISRDALVEAVWPGVVVTNESLTQCIRDLRRAFGSYGKEIIQTEYRRGYRFNTSQATKIATEVPQFSDFEQQVGHTVSEDGTQICYAVAGSGPVLVRAPHWMTHIDYDWCSEIYGPLLCRFAKDLTLVRFDARGTGRSQRNIGPGALDDWVADMRAVMVATGFDRYCLLGGSAGAQPVVKYAATYPESVSSLILLGGIGRGQLHRGVSEEHVAAFAQLVRDGWAQKNPAFRQLMTTGLWPDASRSILESFNELQRMSSDPETAARLLEEVAKTTVEPFYSMVQAPTLLVHSLHDERAPYTESELAAQLIPNASLYPLESTSHTPVWSEPAFEVMMRAIIDFATANS